jgi:hypothetical protein
MKMIKPNGSTRPPIKEAIAAVCGVGLLLCAAVEPAEAAQQNTTVRDHRTPGTVGLPGGVKVTPRPSARRTWQSIEGRQTIRCSGSHWTGGPAACRDHRR